MDSDDDAEDEDEEWSDEEEEEMEDGMEEENQDPKEVGSIWIIDSCVCLNGHRALVVFRLKIKAGFVLGRFDDAFKTRTPNFDAFFFFAEHVLFLVQF